MKLFAGKNGPRRLCAWLAAGWLLCWCWGNAWAAKPPAAAVATAHPLATQAGQEILQAGGNAFDAAVAISAALAVVEPTGSGLGGGGFYLLHEADRKRDIMVDARERAPRQATRTMYLDSNGQVLEGLSINGPLAAGIPGIPAGIAHLAEQYGRLPLAASLAPAIRYARKGFPLDEHYRTMATWRRDVLQRYPAAASIFLSPDGGVPAAGSILKQPELARTLEALAERGAAGFYHGAVADLLVEGVRDAGGIWTHEDLAEYKVVEREPVRGRYGDLEVISAAPPSSGGVALVTMLNILAPFPLQEMDPAPRTHVIVEAMRRAYRDRADYLGDTDFVDVPVARLTHPYYAAGLRASIRMDRATPSAMLPGANDIPKGSDTTHFSVLDREGNRVAATLSINLPFGSGFAAPGTGVLLNNEMDDFSVKPGVPNSYGLIGDEANAIAPGKRPLSSMSPTFVVGEERVCILGTPGGSRIITMVLLGVLECAAGRDPEAWVSRPRFHHQFRPDAIQFEPGAFADPLREALLGLGHQLKKGNRRYGNMQAILWDRTSKRVTAASDPRGIGKALVIQ